MSPGFPSDTSQNNVQHGEMAPLLSFIFPLVVMALLLGGLVEGVNTWKEAAAALTSHPSPSDILSCPCSTPSATLNLAPTTLTTVLSTQPAVPGITSTTSVDASLPSTSTWPDEELLQDTQQAKPTVIASDSTLQTLATQSTPIAKRQPCTSAGIVFDCGAAPTSAPRPLTGQGCGKASKNIGSTNSTIQAAAFTFYDMYFPGNGGPRILQSGSNGLAATIGVADGNKISFEAR